LTGKTTKCSRPASARSASIQDVYNDLGLKGKVTMFKTWASRYTLLGFALGLILPVVDIATALANDRLPLTLDSLNYLIFGEGRDIDRGIILLMPVILSALLGVSGRQRDKSVHRLSLIADIRSVLNQEVGLESLLNLLALKWARLLAARECTFATWDAHGNRSAPLHPRCPYDEASASIPVGEAGTPLARWVIDHNRVQSVTQAGGSSVLAAPLAVNNVAFGAVIFSDPHSTGRLTRDRTLEALAIADQVALTIDHLRAGAELRRRARDMEAINQVARRIAAGWGIDRILTTVADNAQVRFGFDYVGVLTVDEETSEFAMRAQSGPLAQSLVDVYRQPLTQGLIGRAYQTGQQVLARDVQQEPDYVEVAPGLRSELIIPLRSGARVIGVMSFGSRYLNAFREEDIAALQILADQVAVAVENARLYDETQRERQRLSAVLASTNDAVILIDAADRVQLFNRAAERLFGVTTAQAIGARLDDALRLPQLIDAYRHAPSETHVFELALDDGTTLLANLTSVRDETLGLRGRLMVLHDITDLKRLDQLKSQMIRMASHDLRNPLNMAFGYLDLLTDAVADSTEKAGPYLEGLEQGLWRMRKLIEDLLDVERIESAADRVREPVDLNQVLLRAADELKPQAAGKRQELIVQTAGAPVCINADPVQIQQVVVNLLNNAIKYTPDGGRIQARVRRADPQVLFEVEDNGLGIPKAAQAKLFQRFYRVKMRGTENIEGTGLGLSLVKAVVEQHKGTIEVDSDEGRGSLFRVRLPALAEEQIK